MRGLDEAIRAFKFGTELEIGGTGSPREAVQVLARVLGGEAIREDNNHGSWITYDNRGRKWTAEKDGSLNDDDCEIVTPPLEAEDLPLLRKVLDEFYRHGARPISYGSQHVHVGVKNILSPSQIAALVAVFAVQENIIYDACNTFPDRENRYCHKFRESLLDHFYGKRFRDWEWSKLNRTWFEALGHNRVPRGETVMFSHYSDYRYQGINLNNLWPDMRGNCSGTVEFRLFNCPESGKAAMYNALLALALCAYVKNVNGVKAREIREESHATSKYDMRVFLNRVGFIGPQYAEARAYYLRNCAGDCAFKHTARP